MNDLGKGGYIHAKGFSNPERGEELIKMFRDRMTGSKEPLPLRPGESVELVLPPQPERSKMNGLTEAQEAKIIFSTVETILVGLHDGGLLTLAALDAVGNTWRGYEMLPQVGEDESGNTVLTNDGLYLSDIALDLIDPGFSPESESHSWDRFAEVAKERWGWK